MKFSLILLLLAAFVVAEVVLAQTISAEEGQMLWSEFKNEHGKEHSVREDSIRKDIFLNNHKKIRKHNKSKAKWTMAHNIFSDMTPHEKREYLGFVIDVKTLASKQEALERHREERAHHNLTSNRDLPESVDHRDCLVPPKDQGRCGSCWAFASTPSIEYHLCKKTGVPVSLSEQQLISCNTHSYGCGGGFFLNSYQYLKETGHGMSTDADYPYTSGENGMNSDCTATTLNTADGPHVAEFNWLPENADAIMRSLVENGPVGTGITISDAIFSYSSGVYSDPFCIGKEPMTAGHAVVIVGYGTLDDTPYWIIRNSWSTSWGDGGYALFKRGSNECNIEAWPAYLKGVY